MSEPSNTWKKGDTARYMMGEIIAVFAGLYFYHGLGMGYLYRPNGDVVWCAPSDAAKQCAEDGVEYKYRDSFDGYRATYLGD